MGDNITKSSDYIKQPYPLSQIRGDLSLNQQRILVGMMDILDSRVSELLRKRPEGMKLFSAEDLDEEGNINIEIPLSLITSRADEYADIERVAPLLTDAKIVIDRGDSIEYVNSFTSLTVPKTKSTDGTVGRRKGFIRVKMSQYQANLIFNYERWSPFRKSVSEHSRGAYTLKLYLMLTEERFRGNAEYDYHDLRQRCGCDSYFKRTVKDENGKEHIEEGFEVKKYKEYRNFHARVLQSAEKELRELAEKGLSDIYFSFRPIHEGKGSLRQNPIKVHFDIFTTEQGKLEDIRRKASMRYIALEHIIVERFELTKAEANSILKGVSDDVAEQFEIRVNEIASAMEKKSDIKDKKKYAIKSLYAAVAEFSGNAKPNTTVTEASTVANTSQKMDPKEKWIQCIARMREEKKLNSYKWLDIHIHAIGETVTMWYKDEFVLKELGDQRTYVENVVEETTGLRVGKWVMNH